MSLLRIARDLKKCYHLPMQSSTTFLIVSLFSSVWLTMPWNVHAPSMPMPYKSSPARKVCGYELHTLRRTMVPGMWSVSTFYLHGTGFKPRFPEDQPMTVLGLSLCDHEQVTVRADTFVTLGTLRRSHSL